MKRITSIILALAMLLSMVSVSSFAVAEGSELEHVTIDWYVMEEAQTGNQVVWDALNAYFKEKINTTVNFHYYGQTEYSTQVTPILSIPQTSDMIINANSQLSYVNNAQQENFVALEELLPIYAPKTWEMIPEQYWELMKVNGHIYGIPSYKDSVQFYSLLVNKDLADKIGLDYSSLVINNGYDIINMMYDAQAKRNEIVPEDAEFAMTREAIDQEMWFPAEVINGLVVANIPGIESYAGKGSGETVFNKYATDEYRDMVKTIAQAVADNLIPEMVWYFDSDRIYSYAGKYIQYGVTSGRAYVPSPFNPQDTFDTVAIPFANAIATTDYIHNAVNAIRVNSEHPERVLMLLELINTDPWVATTIRFGTEGDFWYKTENGQVAIDGTLNEEQNGNYYWHGAQFGAIVYSAVPADLPEDYIDALMAMNEIAVAASNNGFIFDPTPVQNEVASCNAVIGEYEVNLKFGFIPVDEVDANVDEFLAKLEASGASKVVEEAQRQLDAWRAENNK